MKPTSVIFIIISVLLACVGVLLMVTAENMADTQGIALFAQTGDENNNFSSTVEFDGDSIKKIVLSLSDVDVNVIGRAEKNAVELVNFPDGTYELSASKSTLQLNDNTAITNIIDVDNLKINFNGFRDYLHYFKYREKARTVNLYLTEDAAAIIFNVTTGGNVTLKDLNIHSDYKIKVSDGDVTLENVKTDSSVIIDSTDDSNIELNNVNVNDIEINGVTAYATLKKTTVARSLYIKILSGNVDYEAGHDFSGFLVHFQTDSGVVNYGDERIINGSYIEDNTIDYSELGEDDPTGEPETPADPAEEPEETDPELTDSDTEEPQDETDGQTVKAYTVTILLTEGNITVH